MDAHDRFAFLIDLIFLLFFLFFLAPEHNFVYQNFFLFEGAPAPNFVPALGLSTLNRKTWFNPKVGVLGFTV